MGSEMCIRDRSRGGFVFTFRRHNGFGEKMAIPQQATISLQIAIHSRNSATIASKKEMEDTSGELESE